MAEKEYFVLFANEEEKLKFVDEFCGAAMNNWRAPFKAQYGGLIAFILIHDSYVEFFNRKFPNLKFIEATDIQPSWVDPVTGKDCY